MSLQAALHFFPGTQSRIISVNDLEVHILEANHETAPALPLALLLHGFPELSFSWRKILGDPSLKDHHLVAPDIRGYGLTRPCNLPPGHKLTFEEGISPFKMSNLINDAVGLVHALGYSTCNVVGHDFGSPLAAYCALTRPDIFKSVVMMSAPFTGPPLPLQPRPSDGMPGPSGVPEGKSLALRVNEQLNKLDPPRKHYTVYFSSKEANADLCDPSTGSMRNFLRTYYHVKSAKGKGNEPAPLTPSTGIAVIPHYYIMPLDKTMPESVAPFAPSLDEVAADTWLTDEELSVYVDTYTQTGFQGGLNHYRCGIDNSWSEDLSRFHGRRIEVPAMFLSGKQDWGVYQTPGAVDGMRYRLCERMGNEDFILLEGAGHWVQQEQPVEVARHLLRFWSKAGVNV